jgi:hypothetical protein
VTLTESQARILTQQAQRQAADLRLTLKHLHDGKAHKALGYATWADYVANELEISLRTFYNHVRMARGLENLNAVCATAAHDNPKMLYAFGGVPDDLVATVYQAAKDESGNLSEERIKDALTATNTVIVTGAVEDADGTMRPVLDPIAGYVTALAADRKAGRDNVRWVLSRAVGRIGTMGDPEDGLYGYAMSLVFDKPLETLLYDLQFKRVVISIGIEDEGGGDAH